MLQWGSTPRILENEGGARTAWKGEGEAIATNGVIRTVCGHDCPDMCSLLAHVENGRLVRIQGDPAQPFTAGFVCAKVSREHELVHSQDRIVEPLVRSGTKGTGSFAAATWDDALDEIVDRWRAIIREHGPLAIQG